MAIQKKDAWAFNEIQMRNLFEARQSFEDFETLSFYADMYSFRLNTFQDIHSREPYHPYEVQQFQEDMASGYLPRLFKENQMGTVIDTDTRATAPVQSTETNYYYYNGLKDAVSPVSEITELHSKFLDTSEGAEFAAGVSRGEAGEDPKSDEYELRACTMQELRSIDAYMSELTEKGSTDNISKAVSGSHYNDVVPGFQYMQMMQYMLEDKEGVEAHLLGQVYKYLMRSGKKDDVEQEYRKARWYLNCLVKYKQTGIVDPNNND